MKNYQKPIIIANRDLSEGVYAASGDTKNYTVLENGRGENYRVYLVTNTSNENTITIYLYGNVTDVTPQTGVFGAPNVQCVFNNDNTATVTFLDDSVKSVHVRIKGEGKPDEFGIVE